LCDETHPYHSGALAAYLANVGFWESTAASDPETWGWITALGLQYFYGGMGTLGTTELAGGAFGVGTPFTVAKSANEPFAWDGDLDGDGYTNLEEYQFVSAAGGSREQFVYAASGGFAGPGVPVAGLLGLGLLAAVSGAAGFLTLRKGRKSPLTK